MNTTATMAAVLAATCLSSTVYAEDAGADLAAKAKAAFAQAVAEYDIPGLVVGVTRNGSHSFYQTGVASREAGVPATPDTLFELGSISKIFNVTLAALADERGDLSLASPVETYLPDLKGTPAGALTLMDLATHHSGGLPLQVPDEAATAEELLDWLKEWQPPQPGARSYSNISIGLLGHISAKAMGMDYTGAAETVLFPDLGLENTWIDVPAEAMPHYAFGYDRKTDAPIRVTPGVLDSEAYGVKSSARDMLTLLDVQLGLGDVSSEIRTAVVRTQESRFSTSLFDQAMVWEAYEWPADLDRMIAGNGHDFILSPQRMEATDVPAGPRVILNKTGATNGFGGYVVLVPDEKLGVVVLANRNYPNEARVRATHQLLESLLAE